MLAILGNGYSTLNIIFNVIKYMKEYKLMTGFYLLRKQQDII